MATAGTPTKGHESHVDETAEDDLTLPTDTLALLDSFYKDRDAQTKVFEDIRARAEKDAALPAQRDDADEDISIDAFTEDWQASQFWYDDATATTLATALLRNTTSSTSIAVISTPSVYLSLRKIVNRMPKATRPPFHLLEYDDRFAILPNFTHYDYIKPFAIPPELTNRFDVVIADPPFLSEDCHTKTAMTVRRMAADGARIMVCTGAVMEPLISRLYGKMGVKRTEFKIRHTKGLSNDFACFANFEVGGVAEGD